MIEVTGRVVPDSDEILTPDALAFVADLQVAFGPRRETLLQVRRDRQAADGAGPGLALDSPEGKSYRLDQRVATLVVRPRGWHLAERHVLVDGEPMSASLFDVGLYLFHNATERERRGERGSFFLPQT